MIDIGVIRRDLSPEDCSKKGRVLARYYRSAALHRESWPHCAGLREVILPKRDEGDLEDVPEPVREQITFHLVDTGEVLDAARGRHE